MARSFCSMRPFPPFLFPTFSPVFTCMRHPFCWFWAAFRHASMNLAFAAATSGWTKPSVSSSYSRLLSAASRWACAVDWLNSTSATGHLALTAKHPQAEFHPTPPSWNPSSTNMACSFCSMTPISPSLFLNSSLGYTAMLHLFRSFWVAFRHASMNLSLCVATKAWTKRSVSRSYACSRPHPAWFGSTRGGRTWLCWYGLASRVAKGRAKNITQSLIQHHVFSTRNLPKHCPSHVHPCSVSSLNLNRKLSQLDWFSPTATLANKRKLRGLLAHSSCNVIILVTHVANVGNDHPAAGFGWCRLVVDIHSVYSTVFFKLALNGAACTNQTKNSLS